ncbi:nitroreductase [Rhabdaerophilum sp. SD176]|uniref:nitroreductase family protein n=1 Tax=Rhabdaerophilum sp. SD176 TaxID=2983548 RepID=UPI0024DF7435|nr:nitroreductase [Rhabdaerophilum sp. SD176]
MPPSTHPVIDALFARRSANARMLTGPAPDDAQLRLIVEAASRAPDHGRIVPFRFLALADAARGRLADLLGAATREMMPDAPEEEIQRAREKAHQGPCLVGVLARIDAGHPKIPASDQWLAVGCALENLVLAVQALGFAAAIRSGRFLETKAFREGFGLGPNEHFVSIVAIGTTKDWPPAKPKPALDTVFGTWNG